MCLVMRESRWFDFRMHAVHAEYRTISSSMPMPIRAITKNARRCSLNANQLKYTAVLGHPQPDSGVSQ